MKAELSVPEPSKAERDVAKGHRPGHPQKRTTVKSSTVLHNTADESDHEESPRSGGYYVMKYMTSHFPSQVFLVKVLHPYDGGMPISQTFLFEKKVNRLLGRYD